MGLRQFIPNDFFLGATCNYKTLASDENLRELITNNFNLLTAENSFKLGHIGKIPDAWNFEGSDYINNFAIANGLKMRGHLMLWARSMPEWLQGMSTKQFTPIIKDYIQSTLARYPSIIEWDICGESYDDRGNLRDTLLSYHLGDDWVKIALNWARECRPDIKLFYSENRTNQRGKQLSILNLIDSCKLDQAPIDGISIQLHYNLAGLAKLVNLFNFIEKIQDRGVEVQFTEVTLWNQFLPVNNLQLYAQSLAYSELLNMAFVCGVNTFNIWGTIDKHAWRFPEKKPFLFDDDYQPKPAYFGVERVLSRFRGKHELR